MSFKKTGEATVIGDPIDITKKEPKEEKESEEKEEDENK